MQVASRVVAGPADNGCGGGRCGTVVGDALGRQASLRCHLISNRERD